MIDDYGRYCCSMFLDTSQRMPSGCTHRSHLSKISCLVTMLSVDEHFQTPFSQIDLFASLVCEERQSTFGLTR